MWARPAAGRHPNEDHVICLLSILWARLIVELNTRLFPDTGATGDRGRAVCEFQDRPDNVKPSLGGQNNGSDLIKKGFSVWMSQVDIWKRSQVALFKKRTQTQ